MITSDDFNAALIARHGADVYERLKAGSAAICGLGGLGSNTAVALARAGVGKLLLIDFDRVDISNLNRQYYFADDIGKYKTDALAAIIRRVNPVIELETKTMRMTEENSAAAVGGYNLVCECFDGAESKAMLINTLLAADEKKIIVSASGMAGYCSSNSITTKNPMNGLYLCGDGISGIEDGDPLMAPRVGLCAMHQANMTLRLMLGEKDV